MSPREQNATSKTTQILKKYILVLALFLAFGAFASLYLDTQETRIAGLAIAVLIVVFGLRHMVGRQGMESRREEIEQIKQRMSEPRNTDDS